MNYTGEKFGIYDIIKVTKDFKVKCCNCMNIFYEDISDERNNNALYQFYDKENGEYFLGCPECETDEFLMNIDAEN